MELEALQVIALMVKRWAVDPSFNITEPDTLVRHADLAFISIGEALSSLRTLERGDAIRDFYPSYMPRQFHVDRVAEAFTFAERHIATIAQALASTTPYPEDKN